MIDIETVSFEDNTENQFTFDFTLPNKSQASNDAEKLDNEPDDLEVPIEAEDINEAMDFKFEIIEKSEQTESLNSSHKEDNSESKSPFDKSIKETIASENEKRKEHLKKFNHSFKHNLSKIDEFEKQPAYKRMGLDLEQHSSSDSDESRMSLDKDKNDDIQLRSNNSFLHDNVD